MWRAKPPNRQTKTSGSWKPLEATEFEGLRRGVEALQFLQRAQHIGKAQVLRVDDG